jgi:NitT/TauT family transport system substrate-binding protein
MRRILAVVAIAATLLATAACKSDDDRAAPVAATKVGLGVIPIVDVAPVYLGKAKGFFSSRGIDLTLVLEQSGAVIVKSVLAGKYQFGFSNVTSLMAADAGGAPIKAVAAGVASTGRPGRDFSAVMVRNGSLIVSPRDLAGKRVAVNALKSLGDTTIRQSVRKAGGNPAGIQFVAMPFPDMPGALQNGKVDAVWVVEPQLSETLTQGGQVLASNLVDTAPDMTVAMYFTGTALIAKDPTLVSRFTAAVDESLRYAAGHPDEVRTTVGTYTKINDTVRSAMILPYWPSTINRASLERLATLGAADGIFPKPPSLDKLLP